MSVGTSFVWMVGTRPGRRLAARSHWHEPVPRAIRRLYIKRKSTRGFSGDTLVYTAFEPGSAGHHRHRAGRSSTTEATTTPNSPGVDIRFSGTAADHPADPSSHPRASSSSMWGRRQVRSPGPPIWAIELDEVRGSAYDKWVTPRPDRVPP